jgi:hypothetical protein
MVAHHGRLTGLGGAGRHAERGPSAAVSGLGLMDRREQQHAREGRGCDGAS